MFKSTTVSDMLMDTLANRDVDTMKSAFLIWRREDGTIGYRPSDDQDLADSMGILDFVKISLEAECRKIWNGD